jgi:hypothetical protein
MRTAACGVRGGARRSLPGVRAMFRVHCCPLTVAILSACLLVCLCVCLFVCLCVCLSVARCTLSAALLHATWQGADVLWAGLPLITLARETVLAAPSVLTRYSHGTQGVIKERDGTDRCATACDVPKLDRAHSLHGAARRTMRHPRSSDATMQSRLLHDRCALQSFRLSCAGASCRRGWRRRW